MNMSDWATSGKLLRAKLYNDMEPLLSRCVDLSHRYGIFRRSVVDPLFHPFFYDYGGDKQDFYNRLMALHCLTKRVE